MLLRFGVEGTGPAPLRRLPHNPCMPPSPPPATLSPRTVLLLAVALSMGAAISLGITRFAYGLLLPPMRTDLGWSYTLAGAMNTVNALGYLLGALVTPRLLQRMGAARLMLAGAWLASLFMALSGFFTDATPLLLQRLLAGVASAFIFVAGGLLAARLGGLQRRAVACCWGCITAAPAWASWCRRCWYRPRWRPPSATPRHTLTPSSPAAA